MEKQILIIIITLFEKYRTYMKNVVYNLHNANENTITQVKQLVMLHLAQVRSITVNVFYLCLYIYLELHQQNTVKLSYLFHKTFPACGMHIPQLQLHEMHILHSIL